LREVQGIQQHVVHNRKDSGISPDAERQRQDGDSREAGRFAQHTQANEYILNHGLKQLATHRLAAFFAESFIAAELDARPAFCLDVGQAGTFQIVDAVLDVRRKLFPYFALSSRAMKESVAEGAKVSNQLHISSGRAARAQAMAAARRFHGSASSGKRLRAADVRS
jgi:hypothetical protein